MTKHGKSFRKSHFTVDDISQNKLTEIAYHYWAPFGLHKPFDASLILNIYHNELLKEDIFSQQKIVMLEISQYLERYLWLNFDPEKSTKEHIMSIVVMINEKYRERISAWQCIVERPDFFPEFFYNLLSLAYNTDESQLNFIERSAIAAFLVNCLSSLEVDVVRNEFLKIVSLQTWENLLPEQLSDHLEADPALRIKWKKLQDKKLKMTETETVKNKVKCCFLWKMLEDFIYILQSIDSGSDSDVVNMDAVHYLEHCLELFIDLEALLTTRRFFNPLLHASNLITYSTLSSLIKSEIGDLFCQLMTMLKFYSRFEIDEITGEPLTTSQMLSRHYKHITGLQKAAFMYFRESMKEFCLLNVSAIDSRKALLKQFGSMSNDDLYKFAEYLHLVKKLERSDSIPLGKQFLSEAVTLHCERRVNQLQQLNEQPLYPTEKTIWDENLVPYDEYNGHDEIRKDIEDTVFRMKPWIHESAKDQIIWGGWARMALPLQSFQFVEVSKPLVGEKSPAVVRADVSVNVPIRKDIRTEWEDLRKHDVCFLLKCRPKISVDGKYDTRKPFKDQIDVIYVRGCEIEGMLDSSGNVIEEYAAYEKKPHLTGDQRTFRVWLDENQYRLDLENDPEQSIDQIYHSFNLLVRRDPRTNNFKAVLSTIRQLLNTECVVPDWIHDIILGYGDAHSAHYKHMNNVVASLDFCDTFISYKHLLASFPSQKIVTSNDDPSLHPPPYRLTFKELEPQHNVDLSQRDTSIFVESYVVPSRGPYPHVEPRKNAILFTPAQIEAIKSGMQPGLTMVVGPPGAGKTDVAVQIISNIYHNWPEQKTLVVTHSNQALNQLFEKIMALDVDERHLLRLGHGEEALETEKDFSRYGRVNYVLKTRLELLNEVEKLQQSLEVPGDVAYTCETAGHFFLYQVFARWEKFESDVLIMSRNSSPDPSIIVKKFPFTKYFDDAPQPLFKGISFSEDWNIAQGCWRYIRRIFTQLEEFRSFELLRSGRDRTDYLLVKEAKIIAMTCTHAALRRKELVELGFRYDNILMEEAAQILEVETFVPLLLQNPQDGRNRLKRWIMIGDHHQLPPVVQNLAFQKYSNMEQSLFARFVRLGVPHVLLDRQGRSRAEIADLFSWRYKNLGNLPHTESLDEYRTMNAGFVFNYQFIDVPDFNGIGEETPNPYFYQNLGEAEYAVALFTYMRILGYPHDKISIITTYNGQASLLRDVVQRRCAENPLIGVPHKISTVDKYQGQQNDYIILSLVRTKNIGHIRDVRRLIVALSRARLGLYVLGRAELYRNCFELAPAFQRLYKHPLKLLLIPDEPFPSSRKLEAVPPAQSLEIQDTIHMCRFVHELYAKNVDQLKISYKKHMKDYFEARQAAINAELSAKAAAEAAEAAKTEEEKGVAEPAVDDNMEVDITFESMDFELQDPAKLGK